MIYLDYSATTPVANEVLETFNKVSLEYVGNPNSLHKLGINSNKLMDEAIKQMATLLQVKKEELIFTSGATEANNLAIKGICFPYLNQKKRIITTKLEHASVSKTMDYLASLGFEICYVNILPNGLIDIKHLQKLINEDTILVSIIHVNSEMGIVEKVNEIGKLLIDYPKIYFHVDGTQAIGKIKVDLTNIDLYSFSAHKIYGIKGIGCLYKKEKIKLVNLLHGGKSQSDYRGGTPPLALIVSFAKALRLSLEQIDKRYEYVLSLEQRLKEALIKYKYVKINTNENCIPHILNISYIGVKAETMLHALEKHGVYISTQTACSLGNEPSTTIMAVYKDEQRARAAMRISLSYKTTVEEINLFLKYFKTEYEALSFMAGEKV